MKTKISLPPLTYRKLFKKKQQDGFEDKSIGDYVAYLVRDIRLNDTVRDFVQEGTLNTLLPLWMQNFSDNLPYIRFGNNLIMKTKKYDCHNLAELANPEPTLDNPPLHSAIVIGRGPSLFKNKHLEMLSKAVNSGKFKGIICASDGILIECLKHGVLPNLTTTVDGSPIIKKWYDHPLVRKYGSKLNIALSTTTNHEVYEIVKKANCNIFWFQPMFDDPMNIEGWTKIQRLMTISKFNTKPLQTISVGGNTGATSWVMATSLFKCAPTALIGMDMSYPEGTKLEDTPYYSSIINNKIPLTTAYKEVYHPFFKTKAHIDAVFTGYRESFLEFQSKSPLWYHHYGGTKNCSEGGSLWGAGIECMRFADFLSKYHK